MRNVKYMGETRYSYKFLGGNT